MDPESKIENNRGSSLPVSASPRPAARAVGEAELDEGLLDAAVAEINRIYVSKGLETARAIGNYVVDAFFGGDLETFKQDGKTHVTFRALADRDDLYVAYNTIWYSVAVLDQLRLLPEDIAEALPLSHHKLLLPVNDVEAKAELAKRAVEEKLSSRDFAKVVKEARAADTSTGRRGRPPLPAFVKGINRLRRVVELATSEDIRPEALASYSSEEARKAVVELEEQIRRLTELRESVIAAIGETGTLGS